MTISERQLEENEAKIDNILHKIIGANQQIQELSESIGPNSSGTFLMDRVRRIKLLSEIIGNLSLLADEIDIADQQLTEELEVKITEELDRAISDITEAKSLLEKEMEEKKTT
jgi:hypothetical protein